jgi:cytochrome P450
MTSTAVSALDYISLQLSSTTLFLTAVVCAAAGYYYYYTHRVPDDWRRYGVICPKLPWDFFVGKDFRTLYFNLLNQYGDTVGINDNNRLTLVTTNFELLKQILVKDFNNFVDRHKQFLSNSPIARSLFFASGTEWKRSRHIVSPTFSTGKLKYISKSVDKSATDLTDYLANSAKKNELVPIKELTGQYTCEIIAKTAFGLDVNFIGHGDDEFLHYAVNMIRFKPRKGIWRILHMFLGSIPHFNQFATLVLKLRYFDIVGLEADQYFEVTLKNAIGERREQQRKGVKRATVDFLDLILKASDEAAAGQLTETEEGLKAADWNPEGKSGQGLTVDEMIGHSMLIIFAGMETTATTLQMALVELAANPDIQEKVFQEIQAVVKSEIPTPEELNGLTYTEQVINETLRMYTPVPNVNRVAKETRTYNGVTIPKGTVIDIPLAYIMLDPKVFPDPERFDPDRFSQEEREKRDALSFPAFGQGPRLCLGMRLAYLELKQGLVHVIRRLRVVLNEKTEPQLGFTRPIETAPSGLFTPAKTIMLAFELREPSS